MDQPVFRSATRIDVAAIVWQLTTDKKRPDAMLFYERLGFVASHEGMKFHFD
jgi:hypothetical protein